MKKWIFIVMASIAILYIIAEVRKKHFSIKESFWWMIASIIMLVLAIFPKSIDYIANLVGVNYPPSLLFTGCILFLILINFRNNKNIAKQQEQIIELEQHLSILKEGINNEKNN